MWATIDNFEVDIECLMEGLREVFGWNTVWVDDSAPRLTARRFIRGLSEAVTATVEARTAEQLPLSVVLKFSNPVWSVGSCVNDILRGYLAVRQYLSKSGIVAPITRGAATTFLFSTEDEYDLLQFIDLMMVGVGYHHSDLYRRRKEIVSSQKASATAGSSREAQWFPQPLNDPATG